MATLQRLNGRYILQWYDALGQHKKVIGRIGVLPEKEADRKLRAKQYELDTGTAVLGVAPAPFFDDFCKEYLAWHSKKFPDSHYRVEQIVNDHLKERFGNSRLSDISAKEVEDWALDRGRLVSAGSVIKEHRTLQAILNRAVLWKVLPENLASQVEAPKNLNSKPKLFYSLDQVSELLKQANTDIWRLFVNTGMRRAEGMILRREWIKSDALQILSTSEDRTKAGKWREIPLTPGAQEALERLPGKDYVLPRMRLESLSRACIREAKRAQLAGSLHTLRHTYISHLVMAGVELRTVKELAGHSSIIVTEGYSHLSPEHRTKAGLRINF